MNQTTTCLANAHQGLVAQCMLVVVSLAMLTAKTDIIDGYLEV